MTAQGAGDTILAGSAVIEVRVAELFNAIDPSPFLERDLDPKAQEFIVGHRCVRPCPSVGRPRGPGVRK